RDSAIGQVADIGTALEGAGGGAQHGVLHGGLDALGHAADEVLAVLRSAEASVGVRPLHRDLGAARCRVGVLDRLGRAEAGVAGDREDYIGALADQRLGGGLAHGLVGEVAGEQARLGLLVPAEDLDFGVVLLVVVLDAVPEAVHIDGHR